MAFDVGPELDRLIGLVVDDASAIEDRDVQASFAAGFDDEAVFEVIVAAALGASLARLELVDALLAGEP